MATKDYVDDAAGIAEAARCLDRGLDWAATDEGYDYWLEVFQKLARMGGVEDVPEYNARARVGVPGRRRIVLR